MLTQKDFNKLFSKNNTTKDYRTNFILYAIYYWNIYPSTLVTLKIKDLNYLKMDQQLKKFWTKYYNTRKHKKNTDFLVTSIKKQEHQLTTRFIESLITNRSKEVGLTYKVTAASIKFLNNNTNYRRNTNNWRKYIRDLDGNKCIICGNTNNLVTHHIMSAKKYPDLENDVDNGITLCEECHKKYHNFDNYGSARSFILFITETFIYDNK